jgi:hypothetical protein
MTSSRKVLVVAVLIAAAGLWATPASAQCTSGSRPFGNLFGTAINGCDDSGPMIGMAFSVSPAAITVDPTTGQASPIVCTTAADVTQGGQCDATSDPPGAVTINGNWSNTDPFRVTGCPNPDGLAGVGRNYYAIRDSKGKGVTFSVGWDTGIGGYITDFAGPGDFTGLSCGDETARPKVVRSSTLTGATKLDLAAPTRPHVFNDCDPSSLGFVFTNGATCPEGSIDSLIQPGNFYTTTGDCTGRGLSMQRSRWTLLSAITNPDGTRSVTVNKATVGLCAFVGSSFFVGTTESSIITGATSVGGEGVVAPAITNLRATRSGGNVRVEWNVTNEIAGLSFSVLTKKSGGPVLEVTKTRLSGDLSGSYRVDLKVADFRGSKEVAVRIYVDGAPAGDSASVNF